ncbi:DEAD/DEAH box helicase [Gordonia jinhuaensis]|uniref:ATP-dependent RNA helicase n=1 Tax=Gordonia jinhuaensis TaxID=1517702 RepID=A0A916SWM2_9ACTN|nr:DEAD/DEAH box helicase [Gordonia jinhuaensis]GGB20032.1 putative ATP-dependent RNA helicase [Gordonia jinhuaensis]
MSNTFASLGVPAELVKVLASEGKTEPFRIQAETLADTLEGKDVIGSGKTGSGKTLAFAIPMVAGLAELGVTRRPGAPTGLILAPTRELASQIAAVVTPLAKAMNLTVTTVFGGVRQNRQEEAFRRGVDIVVACPGRLEDLMKQKIVRLDDVEITVLDEADHMADLGFLPGVTRLLSATPADGQRMLFTATLDNGVDKVAKRFLDHPVVHSTEETSAPVQMTHHVFEVSAADKNALVHELASGQGRRILFMRTKHQAKKLAKKLTESGVPAVDLHGNLSQAQRDRNLRAFGEEGGVRVLVATDVAARGVHVDNVELVVHVDPPAEHKAYLHRSGRTARAGTSGDVATVCLPEQRRDVAGLLRKAGISVAPTRVNAKSPEVDQLVGPRAEFVTPSAGPAPAPRQQRPRRGSGTANRGGGGQRRGSQQRSTDSTGARRTRVTSAAGDQTPSHSSSRRGADAGSARRGTGARRASGQRSAPRRTRAGA